jgi:carbon-monoxide dehydrogenase medium subunit
MTCDAEIVAVGTSGQRTIRAADFFLGPLMTALAPDELIVALHLPPWPTRRRWAFEEFARQRGAFALAGIALFYDEQDGLAQNTHIGVIGASSRLHRLAQAEAEVDGHAVSEQVIAAAARAVTAEVIPPTTPTRAQRTAAHWSAPSSKTRWNRPARGGVA